MEKSGNCSGSRVPADIISASSGRKLTKWGAARAKKGSSLLLKITSDSNILIN
ncbi:hypothetical protein FTUN_8782 [Frigoriglobus tundricola]|uniref:Uncharacterized protein n=1 Tax=Frigoriglobus tundricola TaxID=2774151 RepID=A0A6M5Z7F2_9BACT|nr:hypothetical protein FTUN_8782 [Frigoriglobus tundricola]